MALSSVILTSEVFRICSGHALTTEAEEVMGLLLGDVTYDEWGRAIARIWAAVPQIRTDRRKDRVEASPEQLAQASAMADRMTEEGKKVTRVIGWYHSHPHITVLPSHVDVRTQAMYQNMDEGFVGLIFSVFNQEADKSQRVQVTAFQSKQQGSQTLPPQRGSWDLDSPMAAAISASMEEAKRNSSKQGQWVHRGVPLTVSQALGNPVATLHSMSTVCRMLYEEEQHAFRQAIADATDSNGEIDPLTALHQGAEYQQHLARLIELVVGPSLGILKLSQTQTQWRQQQLRDLRDIFHHKKYSAASPAPAERPVEGGTGKLNMAQQPSFAVAYDASSDLPPGADSRPSSSNARPHLLPQFKTEHTDFPSVDMWDQLAAIPTQEDAVLGPANVVKVTLTDWIRDQPGEAPPAMEQLASRDSEAELAAAIEASKLSAPDPYWDALGVEDREREPPPHAETAGRGTTSSQSYAWPESTDWDERGSNLDGTDQAAPAERSEASNQADRGAANGSTSFLNSHIDLRQGNFAESVEILPTESAGQSFVGPKAQLPGPADPFSSLLDHASLKFRRKPDDK